jgi:AMMECR1 domain-containing protein
LKSFPWRPLRRGLTDEVKRRSARQLRALVRWQRQLRTWPRLGPAPDADPFVSLYVGGSLRGCFGSGEGAAGERVARAFLLAAADSRFPSIDSNERERLVAQVSYCLQPRLRQSATIGEQLEVGVHGVAIVLPDGRRTAVLPDVARDHGMSASRFLAGVRAKLGLEGDSVPRGIRYFTFETANVTSRTEAPASPTRPSLLAAKWLAAQIGPDGAIGLGVDPRTGESTAAGTMLHGRSAAVIEALVSAGVAGAAVERARGWLGRQIGRGLRGASVVGWPADSAMVAGTLALALRAGIDVRAALVALVASAPEIARSPWHAGQVVAALGTLAPRRLWSSCVADLDRDPVAPWTLLGAIAVGDDGVRARCEAALVEAIRVRGPHVGAVHGAAVPELALTAMATTALRASSRSSRVVAAIERGTTFLRRWQFVPGTIPASLEPAVVAGAFPLSPVHPWLRPDVTAHALLALGG